MLPTRYLQWDKVDVNAYQCSLSSLLSLANVPHCLIRCHAPTCVDHDHFDVIEYYYNSIVTAVSKATAMIVPPATADRGKMRVCKDGLTMLKRNMILLEMRI